MPELGQGTDIAHARLVRIKFPGVEIKDKRFALLLVDSAEGEASEPIGEEAEIAAAGNWYVPPQEEGCGNGVFKQPVGVLVGETGRVGNAVGIVMDGKNGGVVRKAKFLEDIKRPERFAGYRITGGAVAKDRFAYNVLQNGFHPARIVAKLIRGQVVHLSVPVTVATDGMSLIVDGSYQLGVSFGHPADDKKSGFGVVGGKQVKHLSRVAHHPLLHGAPIFGMHDILEG